jgi:CBS domain-containing protein
MSSELITSTLDDFLSEVKEVLAVNKIKHLVIIEEGKLVFVSCRSWSQLLSNTLWVLENEAGDDERRFIGGSENASCK